MHTSISIGPLMAELETEESLCVDRTEGGEDEGQKVTAESRLMIAKIVCENFKSYAGVKELGPFHKVSWMCVSTLCLYEINIHSIVGSVHCPEFRSCGSITTIF